MVNNPHSIEKIKALILGYLTRHYKRHYPIKEECHTCKCSINGCIHRYEKCDSLDIIMYKSKDTLNRGLSSFCYDPISIATYFNNKYYCDTCSNYKDNFLIECSICLHNLKNTIKTKCNHEFCNDCLLKWIHIHNKSKEEFEAICPICRQVI